ncbi:MAG TPA: DUF3368 domain-containing protein [Thermoanaerobacter sp.]|nr:DUF3368 domain-containing protein [Thermoanaerobacter sp.]
MKVVCNTSPLIFLNSISKLDLLEKLYSEIFIPQSVYQEIEEKGYIDDIIKNIDYKLRIGKYKIYEVKNRIAVKSMIGKLHEGEIEVIISCIELRADFAILDDLLARNKAQSMGINSIGTLGVLLKGFKEGYVDDVESLLDKLVSQGFWISEKIYGQILTLINKKQ